MTDCVVIGGGLIGMLTARELARGGFKTTVVERGETGCESSWAGGGILSPLYPWRYPDAVTQLARWSQREYALLAEELRKETGVDPEWIKSGLLVLDAAEKENALAWKERCHEKMEVLEEQEIVACEPHIGGYEQSALWMPEIAQVRNPRLVRAVRHSLVAAGVRVQEHSEVTALRHEQGRISGVVTAGGVLDAEVVVIAGGAWSAALVEELGGKLDVRPVRGQMLLYEMNPGFISRIILSGERYIIPRRDGHLLVGSTVEDVGFDKSTTQAAFEELSRAAARMVPALAGSSVVRHWAGLRPGTATGVPFIGPLQRIAGVYVNTGHFRNGVLLAPASARLLADLILGRPPVVDPRPYAIAH